MEAPSSIHILADGRRVYGAAFGKYKNICDIVILGRAAFAAYSAKQLGTMLK
jgi:hypothetical protein